MTSPAPLTLDQQADVLGYLLERCKMRDGSDAGKAILMLEKQDLEDLRGIVSRLRRMAPHEVAIKRVVMGK